MFRKRGQTRVPRRPENIEHVLRRGRECPVLSTYLPSRKCGRLDVEDRRTHERFGARSSAEVACGIPSG